MSHVRAITRCEPVTAQGNIIAEKSLIVSLIALPFALLATLVPGLSNKDFIGPVQDGPEP